MANLTNLENPPLNLQHAYEYLESLQSISPVESRGRDNEAFWKARKKIVEQGKTYAKNGYMLQSFVNLIALLVFGFGMGDKEDYWGDFLECPLKAKLSKDMNAKSFERALKNPLSIAILNNLNPSLQGKFSPFHKEADVFDDRVKKFWSCDIKKTQDIYYATNDVLRKIFRDGWPPEQEATSQVAREIFRLMTATEHHSEIDGLADDRMINIYKHSMTCESDTMQTLYRSLLDYINSNHAKMSDPYDVIMKTNTPAGPATPPSTPPAAADITGKSVGVDDETRKAKGELELRGVYCHYAVAAVKVFGIDHTRVFWWSDSHNVNFRYCGKQEFLRYFKKDPALLTQTAMEEGDPEVKTSVIFRTPGTEKNSRLVWKNSEGKYLLGGLLKTLEVCGLELEDLRSIPVAIHRPKKTRSPAKKIDPTTRLITTLGKKPKKLAARK